MPTIGALFQASQIARGRRERIVTAQARGESPEGNYGSALAASNALDNLLAECQVEVDIPPNVMNVVMPFLADITMNPPK